MRPIPRVPYFARPREKRAEMKVGLLIVVLAAQGCAHVVSSNPRSVVVDSWWLDAARAQEEADAECAKYSRVALIEVKANLDETNYVFECVDRWGSPGAL